MSATFHRGLCFVVVAGLLTGSPAAFAATEPPFPTAETAKKKKKQKCKKKKKCKKKPAAPAPDKKKKGKQKPPISPQVDPPITYLSIDPPSHDFGNVLVGTASPPKTFTVTNDGPLATDPAEVSVPPAVQFTLSDDTCTGTALPVTASCTFDITFSAVFPGPISASIGVSAKPGGIGALISGHGEFIAPPPP